MDNAPDILSTTDKPVLISFELCPFVQRSVIVLAEKKQAFVRINIDLSNKPDWFLNISPTGKVPALLVNTAQDGKQKSTAIFESAIINEYLDEQYGTALHPSDLLDKANHRFWISFSEPLLMLQYKAIAANKLVDATSHIRELFKSLIKLKPGTGGYFEGNQFSLIDAAYAPLFTRIKWTPSLTEMLEEHAEQHNDTKNLLTWINNVSQLSVVKNSVPQNFDQQYEEFFLNSDSAILTAQLQFA